MHAACNVYAFVVVCCVCCIVCMLCCVGLCICRSVPVCARIIMLCVCVCCSSLECVVLCCVLVLCVEWSLACFDLLSGVCCDVLCCNCDMVLRAFAWCVMQHTTAAFRQT